MSPWAKAYSRSPSIEVSRIRRNHALEHATLSILGRKTAQLSAAGYSDTSGFFIIGNVSTDQLREATTEALHRLQAGEAHLAIHPFCGTNFAAASAPGVIPSLVFTALSPSLGGRFVWPPCGTNFSRRKLMAPFPPSPACTKILA